MNLKNKSSLKYLHGTIKVIVLLKVVFLIFISISLLMVSFELFTTRNQIEGRELIESTPNEFYFLLTFLLFLIITLLFDRRVLKIKNQKIYKYWIILLILIITTIIISYFFKVLWIQIAFFLLVSVYSIHLLNKFPKRITTANKDVYKK